MYSNCEHNSLLIKVDQVDAVCHTGHPTCFYRRLEADNSLETVRDRWFDPADVYSDQGGVAALTTLWWDAYAFLRDQDLVARSGTSRMLLGNVSAIPRIQDELFELAGVLDGSHVHENQHDDALLEASQVCYWTIVETIRSGIDRDAVRPDRALDNAGPGAVTIPSTMAKLLRETARRMGGEELSPSTVHELFSLVASACSTLGIDPLESIRRDLQELRTRDYLAPYFDR
jgi:hypothetical protein